MELKSLIQLPEKITPIVTDMGIAEILKTCAREAYSNGRYSAPSVDVYGQDWYTINRLRDSYEQFAMNLATYFDMTRVALCSAEYTAILEYNNKPSTGGIKTSGGSHFYISMVVSNHSFSRRINLYFGYYNYESIVKFYNLLVDCQRLRRESFLKVKADSIEKFILNCKTTVKETQ